MMRPDLKSKCLAEYDEKEFPDTDMRTFVVTGSTDGIGLYTALLLA